MRPRTFNPLSLPRSGRLDGPKGRWCQRLTKIAHWGGCGRFLGTQYAANPKLPVYSNGLFPPSVSLMRSWSYYHIYSSTWSMNSRTVMSVSHSSFGEVAWESRSITFSPASLVSSEYDEYRHRFLPDSQSFSSAMFHRTVSSEPRSHRVSNDNRSIH